MAEEVKVDKVADSERQTSNLKAEQPRPNAEVPDYAVVVREYAKWTDNNGRFHKVPLDGTNAVRQPAHEQHELTIEDRDNVDQTLALKTPRRDNAKANEALGILKDQEVRNDEVNQRLASESDPVPSEEPKEGPVEGPDDFSPEPKIGTPGKK
jgi:hypothetical protein